MHANTKSPKITNCERNKSFFDIQIFVSKCLCVYSVKNKKSTLKIEYN